MWEKFRLERKIRRRCGRHPRMANRIGLENVPQGSQQTEGPTVSHDRSRSTQPSASVPLPSSSDFLSPGTPSNASAETLIRADDSVAQTSHQRLAAGSPTTSPNSPTESPLSIGRYQIRATLGSGGFGTVYRAYDPQLDVEVALKVPIRGTFPSLADKERFFREARSAVTIRHPGICPVYEVGETPEGVCYLSLGYVPGESLAERIRRHGPPSVSQAVRWVMDLATAMAEAHHCGVIHRDLKPANILLDARSRPVITDFGLARRFTNQDELLTQEGQILGTPAYMSPEQAQGRHSAVGPLSDQYSLGVILYELLTGRRPYQGSLLDVLNQIGRVVPPAPRSIVPGLDIGLEAICLRAMAAESTERWPDMESLARALNDWLNSTAAQTSDRPGETITQLIVQQRRSLAAWFSTGKAGSNDSGIGGRRSALVGLAAASLALAFGVIMVMTSRGTVRIAVHDPALGVQVNGREVSIAELDHPLTLWTGEHQLRVRYGEMTVETRQFTIHRGANPQLEISYTPAGAVDVTTPDSPAESAGTLPPASSASVAAAPTRAATIGDPPAPVLTTSQQTIADWLFPGRGSLYYSIGQGTRAARSRSDLPPVPWQLIELHETKPRAWTSELRQALRQQHSLAGLDLRGDQLQDADYQLLTELPELTSLSIHGGTPTSEQLAMIGRLSNLTLLRLHDIPVAELSMFRNLSQVSVLWVSYSPGFGPADDRPMVLDGLDQMPAITDLNLGGARLSTADVQHLTRLPRLTRLHLGQTDLTADGLVQLAQCPALQAIFLDHTNVNDFAVETFLNATGSRLYGLSLDHTTITDTAIEPLSRASRMFDINVGNTPVTDAGLRHIRGQTQLSSLWLTNTRVTDAGIAEISNLKQLITLDLSGTAITDASLPTLSGMHRLNYLGCRNTRLSAAGIAQLRAALPACRIDW